MDSTPAPVPTPYARLNHVEPYCTLIEVDGERVAEVNLDDALHQSDDYNRRIMELARLIVDSVNTSATLKARVKELEEALGDYGDHLSTCDARRIKGEQCNCRWDETKALLPTDGGSKL